MASLQSEMERFEQEMKDLGADPFGTVGTSGGGPISVSPPSPVPSAGASNLVRAPSPPARPAQPRPSAVISAAFSSAPVLLPPPPPSRPVSAPASGFFTPQVSYPPARPSSSAPPQTSYFPVPFHLQRQSNQGSISQGPQYQYQSPYQPSPELFTIPHAQQQAQQLFQRDAQTITPEALENVKAALAIGDGENKSDSKKRALPRKAAGQTWEDPTLGDWPENDYRLFCGDLGNEVNDEVLTKAFSRFTTFNMARVVRDKRTGKTKGYGFVSFSNPSDLALALKEMNGKYVGNRPIKLRKSTWRERIDVEALERQKNSKRPKGSKKVSAH